MAQQIINVGSSANSGGGDPLRAALIKVNENFTEVYAKLTALEDGSISTEIIGSLKGSVFADDSTLIIDGSTGAITGDLTGNVTGNTTGYHTGDVTGSVFADDSTVLVDAVNGNIPGYVKIADLKTALQDGAGDYAAFKAWVLANL
jgi:hypothetical protein